MGYFWDPPGKTLSVSADIERHRREEAELREKIAQLEPKADKQSVRACATYRHLLAQLLTSKASVVDKLGRGK